MPRNGIEYASPAAVYTLLVPNMPTQSDNLRGELIAEFLGTLVLIALGDGVVAMVVLFGTGAAGEVVKGGYTNITLGWGLAVMMGICVAGRVSGGISIPP